jgi:regulator of replication initiation timing
MLQKDKIRKILSKPINRIFIIAVLLLMFLGWVGFFYLRYYQAISQFHPEFEALKSMTESQSAEMVDLRREIAQCKEKLKEIEFIKKHLEEQSKQIFNLSESIVINPKTGEQIYTNKFWNFTLDIPAGWHHVSSFLSTTEETERQQRTYPDKSIMIGSVDFSNEKIENLMQLSPDGLYLSVVLYEHPQEIDLLEWVQNYTSSRAVIDESKIEVAGQKTLLHTFDISTVSPMDGGTTAYGMTTYLKKDKEYLVISLRSINKSGWGKNRGEYLFWKIIKTFNFLE